MTASVNYSRRQEFKIQKADYVAFLSILNISCISAIAALVHYNYIYCKIQVLATCFRTFLAI
ncbi:hypothetical protein [Calothrix sp. NIES-2100]|uniref:hypothetical protein n=1 Tax=Calothrix sp. NIES-2100 TaxID=1954172 RepID=UPI0030DA7174